MDRPFRNNVFSPQNSPGVLLSKVHPYWDEIRRVISEPALAARRVSFRVISRPIPLERPN